MLIVSMRTLEERVPYAMANVEAVLVVFEW